MLGHRPSLVHMCPSLSLQSPCVPCTFLLAIFHFFSVFGSFSQVKVVLGSRSMAVRFGDKQYMCGTLYREIDLDGSTWFIGQWFVILRKCLMDVNTALKSPFCMLGWHLWLLALGWILSCYVDPLPHDIKYG